MDSLYSSAKSNSDEKKIDRKTKQPNYHLSYLENK